MAEQFGIGKLPSWRAFMRVKNRMDQLFPFAGGCFGCSRGEPFHLVIGVCILQLDFFYNVTVIAFYHGQCLWSGRVFLFTIIDGYFFVAAVILIVPWTAI
jgi:hypothetical protein